MEWIWRDLETVGGGIETRREEDVDGMEIGPGGMGIEMGEGWRWEWMGWRWDGRRMETGMDGMDLEMGEKWSWDWKAGRFSWDGDRAKWDGDGMEMG